MHSVSVKLAFILKQIKNCSLNIHNLRKFIFLIRIREEIAVKLNNIRSFFVTFQYKPRFCLLPILFWTVPAGFCLCFICIGVIRGIQYIKMEDMGADEFPFYEIIGCSLVFVVFYVIAIVCYRSVKKSANRNAASDPRPNVKYEVTKGSAEKTQRLRIYPTLVLEVWTYHTKFISLHVRRKMFFFAFLYTFDNHNKTYSLYVIHIFSTIKENQLEFVFVFI